LARLHLRSLHQGQHRLRNWRTHLPLPGLRILQRDQDQYSVRRTLVLVGGRGYRRRLAQGPKLPV